MGGVVMSVFSLFVGFCARGFGLEAARNLGIREEEAVVLHVFRPAMVS